MAKYFRMRPYANPQPKNQSTPLPHPVARNQGREEVHLNKFSGGRPIVLIQSFLLPKFYAKSLEFSASPILCRVSR